MNKNILSTKQAAKYLDLTHDYVKKLVRWGAFPNATKLGREWMIPVEDVESYKNKTNV